MIDARTDYTTDAGQQAKIIEQAITQCQTLSELCGRSGLTRDYLTKLRKGQKTWTFQVQYLLESIGKEAS